MSDMVEKVKAALIAEDEATGSERHLKYWDDLARAAIEAMREPTRDMCKAGADELNTYDRTINFPDADHMECGYQAMIDSALSTKGSDLSVLRARKGSLPRQPAH